MPLSGLPQAVRAPILAEAGDGTIKEIKLETENGRTYYEADVVIDGREIEIKVAPDGTLVGKAVDEDDDDEEDDEGDDDDDGGGDGDGDDDDDEIALDEVPEAARAALLAQVADHAIAKVVRETESGVAFYEAFWEADG